MSGIRNEIEVGYSELDIAAAVVFLKKRAERFGKDLIPLAVKLSPLSPDAGWRAAAVQFIEESRKATQAGIPLNLNKLPPTTGGLINSVSEILQ